MLNMKNGQIMTGGDGLMLWEPLPVFVETLKLPPILFEDEEEGKETTLEYEGIPFIATGPRGPTSCEMSIT